MKKQRCLVACLLIVSFLSCKVSDDTPDQEPPEEDLVNEFSYLGNRYPLSGAVFINREEVVQNSLRFDLILHSSGITVESNGDISGQGTVIFVELNSYSETEITVGRYNVNNQGLTRGKVRGGWINTDFTPNSLTSLELSLRLGGFVSITHDGTDHRIGFILRDENDRGFNGVLYAIPSTNTPG